jgi:hypothetical protein
MRRCCRLGYGTVRLMAGRSLLQGQVRPQMSDGIEMHARAGVKAGEKWCRMRVLFRSVRAEPSCIASHRIRSACLPAPPLFPRFRLQVILATYIVFAMYLDIYVTFENNAFS